MSEPTPTRADNVTFAGQRGFGFVRLSQLAVEHLRGGR
jgi:hypothetical protein